MNDAPTENFSLNFHVITLVIASTENFDVYHTGKEPRGREWLGYGLEGAGFVPRRA
jgi:hypothetical protein